MQGTRQNSEHVNFIPESCTKYRIEAQKDLCLKRSWSDFDPQAYYLYREDQNHETSFKGKALQAAVDSWCKIQVIYQISTLSF
jgi:hypothetical protein